MNGCTNYVASGRPSTTNKRSLLALCSTPSGREEGSGKYHRLCLREPTLDYRFLRRRWRAEKSIMPNNFVGHLFSGTGNSGIPPADEDQTEKQENKHMTCRYMYLPFLLLRRPRCRCICSNTGKQPFILLFAAANAKQLRCPFDAYRHIHLVLVFPSSSHHMYTRRKRGNLRTCRIIATLLLN